MEELKYRWDLERILKDSSIDDLIEEYFNELRNVIKLYEEDIFRSKEKLLYFHHESLRVTILGNRVYNYLQNKYQEDTSNQDIFEKLQGVKIKSIAYHQKLANFSDKAIENKEVIKEYLTESDFKHLDRYYQKLFKAQNHKLPGHVNSFMLTYAPLSSSYEEIFSTLVERNMPLGKIKNNRRKTMPVKNYEDFVMTQLSPDRVYRKNAYYAWHGTVEKLSDTLAQILYYKMLEQNLNARNCNFPDGFYEARMFEDELPSSFVPYIYRKVSRFSEYYKSFKKIRKRRLKKVYKLEGIKPWDLRMPIVKKSTTGSIEIEEAQQMTLEALKIFGPEYVANLQRAFDERWIDWKCTPNKSTGAYCISGCYGLDCKYILMNYQNTLEDVYTLVHELGHAMHAVEYCKYQTDYADTTIFMAEIPSSLNEILLSYHLIEKFKDEPQKQMEIYDFLLNNFFGATINQIILSDWEYEMNRTVNSGRIITSRSAKLVYHDKQQKYQGNRITKPLSVWKNLALASILTIPHFYSQEFYVYKYAIGKIVGLAVALEIRENPQYLEKYFNFLRVGTSVSNLEALKNILGVDLERSSTWSRVKAEIKKWVDRYTALHHMT